MEVTVSETLMLINQLANGNGSLQCIWLLCVHVLMQTNFRRYYFYSLPDQAQTLIDHFNVLDEL